MDCSTIWDVLPSSASPIRLLCVLQITEKCAIVIVPHHGDPGWESIRLLSRCVAGSEQTIGEHVVAVGVLS
jgi:hypothetical protein